MPRTKIQTTGICTYCKSEIDKGHMTTHLKYCKQRKAALAQDEQAHAGQQPVRKSRMLHMLVEGQYRPQYWMHLEVPAWVWLYDLDNFLRAIWLECCGHLSEFKIENVHYTTMSDEYYIFSDLDKGENKPEDETEADETELDESDEYEEIPKPSPEEEEAAKIAWISERRANIIRSDMGPEQIALIEQYLEGSYKDYSSQSSIFNIEEYSMDVKVGKIFKTGIKASYTYDFGSSTYLNVRVLAEREANVYESDEEHENEHEEYEEDEDESEVDEDAGDAYEHRGIRIMARNLPPAIVCSSCGKPAAWISTLTGYNALCDACSKKASRGEAREDDEYEEEGEDRYFGEGLLPVVNSPRIGECAYTGGR